MVGLGLIGGSVARAARVRGLADDIVAVSRRADVLARAQAEGVVDRGTGELTGGVRGADLVVLCTPVGTLPGLVRAIWPALPAGALLTDVGSVKRGVVEAAEACPPRSGVAFVGGHPMAGSERSGYAAAAAVVAAELPGPSPASPGTSPASTTRNGPSGGSIGASRSKSQCPRKPARRSALRRIAAGASVQPMAPPCRG